MVGISHFKESIEKTDSQNFSNVRLSGALPIPSGAQKAVDEILKSLDELSFLLFLPMRSVFSALGLLKTESISPASTCYVTLCLALHNEETMSTLLSIAL